MTVNDRHPSQPTAQIDACHGFVSAPSTNLQPRSNTGPLVLETLTREHQMLHIDIPTLAEFKALAAIKGDTCVSLYVPTEPLRDHERQNRIALVDLARAALQQLKQAGIDRRLIGPLEEQLGHLAGTDENDADDDKIRKLQNKKPDPIDQFWKFQGPCLAVLARS
jgi:hypothetical protein